VTVAVAHRAAALAGVAVLAGVAAVVAGTGDRGHERTAGAPIVLGRPRRQASRTRPVLTRRDAVNVARRFAAAYSAWDAGHRSPRDATRLAATATPGLFEQLSRAFARPTAATPEPLPLVVADAQRGRGSSFLVVLAVARRPGSHIATLVIAPTAAGARVAALER
jgi:hypothetical protein